MNEFVLQVLARLQSAELRREEGQTLAEYGLILALLVVVAAAALSPLGKAIFDTLSSVAGQLG